MDDDRADYERRLAIHVLPAVGGGYIVSDHQVWVAGVYATEAAARRAPAVGPTELSALWDRVRPRPMTDADLDGIAEEGMQVDVVEAPGYREFYGFRRWVRDRAAALRSRADAHGNTGPYHEYDVIAGECEAILKAMGDYWLGPDDSC